MEQIISPSAIKGLVKAPASKSVMQRACAAALIRKGNTIIRNYGRSNDDLAALAIVRQLGARVEYISESELRISSEGFPGSTLHASEINCGESGLSVRMFTPIAALSAQQIHIQGEGSLTTRPLDFFDKVFPSLGVRVESNSGSLPLSVKGPLQPETITIDGSVSSQFLTGLLFAYSAVPRNVVIRCPGLRSKPYINLTLQVMSDFGLPVPENHDLETFIFNNRLPEEASQTIECAYYIEGDWSGAAFLFVAGAIAGSVTVEGLNVQSEQADKRIMEVLEQCGCCISLGEGTIHVAAGKLQPFYFDATHCPDLFPPLVTLAAYAEGKTTIKGAGRLLFKESNRALTLQQEFATLGIPVLLRDDLMIIEGKGSVKGGTVDSHNDHRIAMACAVAALGAEGPITIKHAEAVNKSYPGFYEHIRCLQAFP